MSTLQNVETLVAQLDVMFREENRVLVEQIAGHLLVDVDEFPATLFFHIADLFRPLFTGPQMPPCTKMGGLLARIVTRVIANRRLPGDSVIESYAEAAAEKFSAPFVTSMANVKITAKNLKIGPNTTDKAVIHCFVCGGFNKKKLTDEEALRTTLEFLKALMVLIDELFVFVALADDEIENLGVRQLTTPEREELAMLSDADSEDEEPQAEGMRQEPHEADGLRPTHLPSNQDAPDPIDAGCSEQALLPSEQESASQIDEEVAELLRLLVERTESAPLSTGHLSRTPQASEEAHPEDSGDGERPRKRVARCSRAAPAPIDAGCSEQAVSPSEQESASQIDEEVAEVLRLLVERTESAPLSTGHLSPTPQASEKSHPEESGDVERPRKRVARRFRAASAPPIDASHHNSDFRTVVQKLPRLSPHQLDQVVLIVADLRHESLEQATPASMKIVANEPVDNKDDEEEEDEAQRQCTSTAGAVSPGIILDGEQGATALDGPLLPPSVAPVVPPKKGRERPKKVPLQPAQGQAPSTPQPPPSAPVAQSNRSTPAPQAVPLAQGRGQTPVGRRTASPSLAPVVPPKKGRGRPKKVQLQPAQGQATSSSQPPPTPSPSPSPPPIRRTGLLSSSSSTSPSPAPSNQGSRSPTPGPVAPVAGGSGNPPRAPMVTPKRGRGRPKKAQLPMGKRRAPSPSPSPSPSPPPVRRRRLDSSSSSWSPSPAPSDQGSRKKGRGRPKKVPLPAPQRPAPSPPPPPPQAPVAQGNGSPPTPPPVQPKRGRGRPRKNAAQ